MKGYARYIVYCTHPCNNKVNKMKGGNKDVE